jgi:endonuclease YncB( thermonuclease family)
VSPSDTPATRVQRGVSSTDTTIPVGSQKAQVTVNDNANLRSGPGTDYERVGGAAQGDAVEIVGRNADGDWYQLVSGTWIAAFLVDGAPEGLPVVGDAPEPAPTAPTAAAQAAGNVPAGAVAARLVSVVDGDTVDVTVDGRQETVRYIGIDTPERGQPGYQAAMDANAALLGTGDLFLVADTSDRDRYGRLLRCIYTPDGQMVNREMIAQGWAQPVEYPPDTRYAADLRAAAVEAANAGLGFWGGVGADGAMPYALTTGNVNIRQGPGTDFDSATTVADNTPLTVFGRTPDGEWLQVRAPDRSGGWVSAGLVALAAAVSQIEVAQDIPAAVAQVDAARSGTAPLAAGSSAVQIIELNPTGDDETVVIQNTGAEPVDMSGWTIQSYGGNSCQPVPEQVFTFPAGFQLAAGAAVRIHSGPNAAGDLVWTRENIWNNDSDRADLRDANGQVVSSSSYGKCR